MFSLRLQQALQLDLPYPERPPNRTGTPAAVLMLFAEDENGEPSLLMTQRTETVEKHKSQMAFPGGMSEESDATGERSPAVGTALRETDEEVGIPPELVQVQGELPPLWTVTDFWVTPVVATARVPLSEVPLSPNAAEIARVFWIPLSVLVAPATYQREFRDFGGVRYPIHVYQVGEYRIWGATGSMIKNLLDRLAALG